MASDGVADYIWSKLADAGENLLDVGQRRYEQEGLAFSYRNCIVATLEDRIVAMLVAFPMIEDPDGEEPDEDPVLAPYGKLEEYDSYYVCCMAVNADYRNQGIGKKLLEIAAKNAKENGYSKLSLIVFEENTGAKALYESRGFKEVLRERVVPHPLIQCDGDALLMVKKIDPAD